MWGSAKLLGLRPVDGKAEHGAANEEHNGHDPGDNGARGTLNAQTLLVARVSSERNYQVNERPYSEATDGDELQNAGANLAEIEPVNANRSQ